MIRSNRRIYSVLIFLLSFLIVISAISFKSAPAKADTAANKYDVNKLLEVKHALRFDKDGNFKILIFSDIQSSLPIEQKTLDFLEAAVSKEKPDLVILAGDNEDGTNLGDAKYREYLLAITEPMNKRKIPWCHVYGNHEGGAYNWDNGVDKAKLELLYESLDYCVSKGSTVDVYGDTNYVLPILRNDSDKIGFNVFCLDTHDYMNKWKDASTIEKTCFLDEAIYSEQADRIYDVVHFDQIRWYWKTSCALEQYNGSKVPAMIVQHIPLIEWDYIYRNQTQTGMTGSKGEAVCAPQINSGLFSACLERGDVVAIFSGHDHINDFSGTYADIILGYCGGAGFHEYGMGGAKNEGYRTARVVTINQEDAYHIETYMIYSNSI